MIGQSIAHFEITAKIGEGGMGEVYQATDTRLNRQVALKILPQVFAQDKQRMSRFAREAQVLASLNHPHIAGIYGLEEDKGTRAEPEEMHRTSTCCPRAMIAWELARQHRACFACS